MRIGFFIAAVLLCWPQRAQTAEWSGTVRNQSGNGCANGTVELRLNNAQFTTAVRADGGYRFASVPAQRYNLSIHCDGRTITGTQSVTVPGNGPAELTLLPNNLVSVSETAPIVTSGETLNAQSVSEIPLNKRDFSQLLLLAAGTMTDANGTTNFTQQFAINGQRGVEAVFAMDGADISDPELGGATFSNFNVDAVQEIQSSSGFMPAEIGRGAAGFTNIVTRAGTNQFHGSLFEFVRNSAFDARNFFDRRSFANPGRIPPFRRNEFGVTLGGPLFVPGLSSGQNKTYFFAQYQGFRQVLGTTQVLPVPTAAERAGFDTTAFPGDTLLVPVNQKAAALINRYPLPNDPHGSFGARTYATSSKVTTNADQFSVRLDHKHGSKNSLFARFAANNLTGPTTNPDQTAIDPSFGILYIDHQRNGVLTWTRTPTANFISESSISVTRTTPSFPTANRTDPALVFSDGFYEPFNSPGGSVTDSIGNLYQGRQSFAWTRHGHSFKAGAEFRANRDSTYFGLTPNGQYTFGGGTSYAPVNIRSLSGAHDIQAGSPLPDTLSALLTGSAFAYTGAVAPANFPQGNQIGVAAVSRYGVNFFVQDSWKISPDWVLDYGLRYELYWPITERAQRGAGVSFHNDATGPHQDYLINPQPPYKFNANGWGPRVSIGHQLAPHLWLRAGGAITTIPPNIWQDNLLTGAAPYVDYPRLTAASTVPLLIGTRISPQDLPGVYTPTGVNILASGNSKLVPPNTVWDINRFEQGIAALNPSHQITPLNVNAISKDFHNAYLATWTVSLERQFNRLTANAAYVGTAGISLPAINFPNGYSGAAPGFAPYTQFDAAEQPSGGFGTESLMTNRSHSSYHALQTSLQGTVPHGGPSIQASYTWSKSLDDASTVVGGFISGASGATAPAVPQNPFDTRAEKGPSSFDIAQAFTLSAIQDLPTGPLPRALRNWQLLTVATLLSGPPFTVYSGVQQTGAGSNGVDRPDQIGIPTLSISRTVREDYFGQGANNAEFFSIPTQVAGGSGPNEGRFGTLGRNTFRGPGLVNFDFALIKNILLGSRAGRELADLQFRTEFFNLFNIVNFGLPTNTIKGSGFGLINRTAGTSRQIQFSLKLMF